MSRNFLPAIFILLIIFIAVSGCSGNPATPDVRTEREQSDSIIGSVPDSTIRSNLGYFELTVCTETGDAEIVPVRTSGMHLNVTQMMNNTMGISLAGVPSESDPPNGYVVMDITLTHPLALPQFTGFDVMGIMMVPGTLAVGPLIFSDVDETRLLNADGYTRWWNPTEFTTPGLFGYTQGILATTPQAQLTSTVNPYKYFADSLDPLTSMNAVYNEPLNSDTGRGLFSAGASNTRRYRIQFEMNPGPQVKFGYAVGASWAPANIKPPAEVPDDFPIEANQPEAFYIASSAKVNTLYYDSESGTGGGVLRMQFNVHDWQGMNSGNIAGEVEIVRVFSPDLFASGVNASFQEQNMFRAIYTADLSSAVNPTSSGDSVMIVRVGAQDAGTYDQGFGPAPSDKISAFKTMLVNVVDPECSADSNNSFAEAEVFDLENAIAGQLCAPTDYHDFYRFEFDSGYAIQGQLILNCDAEPTRIILYDSNAALITEAFASDGKAVIELDPLNLLPDVYYIRISTMTSDQAFLYLLEFEGDIYDVMPNPVSVTPNMLNFDVSW
ncbi:MAG TPA: hypothetical protein ENN67_04860, partial [Firmicutes bacterium]|nr:hypothetical protein [Bacillota bacterium]